MSIFNSLPKAFDFGEDYYKSGILAGYLLNIRNHRGENHMGGNIRLSAATSKVPAYVPYSGGQITNITDIVDLHARTLWLGDGRLGINSRGNFLRFLSDYDIPLSCKSRSVFTHGISCTSFIENLIFEFGFWVDKNPIASRAQIFPSDLIVNPQDYAGIEYELKKLCDTEKRVLAAENDTYGKGNDFDEDEFVRGMRDGYNYNG